MKSISLDIERDQDDNDIMSIDIISPENSDKQVGDVVETWLKGEEFETDGYEDLGLTLKQNAIKKALTLDKELRKMIADILFPIK